MSEESAQWKTAGMRELERRIASTKTMLVTAPKRRQAALDAITPQDWDAHVGCYARTEGGLIRQAPFLDTTVRDMVKSGAVVLFLNDGRILDLVYGGWRP